MYDPQFHLSSFLQRVLRFLQGDCLLCQGQWKKADGCCCCKQNMHSYCKNTLFVLVSRFSVKSQSKNTTAYMTYSHLYIQYRLITRHGSCYIWWLLQASEVFVYEYGLKGHCMIHNFICLLFSKECWDFYEVTACSSKVNEKRLTTSITSSKLNINTVQTTSSLYQNILYHLEAKTALSTWLSPPYSA